jgi:hypothetical protein
MSAQLRVFHPAFIGLLLLALLRLRVEANSSGQAAVKVEEGGDSGHLQSQSR